MDAQPDQDDPAARTSLTQQQRYDQLQAARGRAADAHQRAARVHEQAAAFYAAHGDAVRADRERHGAEVERRRLREVEELIAAATPPV